VETVTDLADAVRRLRLLEPAQLDEVGRTLQGRFPEPKALARELVRRGWLTPYQVNQLFQGRGDDLLLGSYVVLERLGQGGMGQVFKARNWKLGGVVAIKVIRKEHLANPVAVQRFRREIEVVAKLDHPNIVRALDADHSGDSHFLVMEYVEGTDLSKLTKERGPLPVGLACDFARQAALALQHAHEQGMVHRDIKPGNLLLGQSPGLRTAGLVKVLDMGLARMLPGAEGDGPETLTREGNVLGSLDYLAPEQAINSHGADIRADLYGLGCTLYYLLTGHVPFPGGSPMDKLLAHRTKEPVPVEERRPEVPPAVAAVVRRLMARQPEDRYATPAEAAVALAGAVSASGIVLAPRPLPTGAASADALDTTADWSSLVNSPPTAEPVLLPPLSVEPARRRRGLWIGVAVAVGLLALIGLLALLLRH
jgi:serine/threonine-protein kinase